MMRFSHWPRPALGFERTALRCATLLLVLTWGEPSLIGAIVQLIERIP